MLKKYPYKVPTPILSRSMARGRVFTVSKKHHKVGESNKVEEDEPKEREGELKIHGGIGAKGDDGVIREKEDGGEGDEQGEIARTEDFRHPECPLG